MQTITYTTPASTQTKKVTFPTKAQAADWLFDQEQITVVSMESTPELGGGLQTWKLTDDHGYRGTIGMTAMFAHDYKRRHPSHTLELVPAS